MSRIVPTRTALVLVDNKTNVVYKATGPFTPDSPSARWTPSVRRP